jgi:uncharacterized protein
VIPKRARVIKFSVQAFFLVPSEMDLRDLVFSGNVTELEIALKQNPALAASKISLKDNAATEVPLHRICDGVFNGDYSEETGIELAKILINYGADVNIDYEPGKDSPLTAACSLRCDKLALYYLDQGADLTHQGCHGGTALHWAAWCGRDVILQKLLTMKPEINQRCLDLKSTPLFWAIHGYKFGGAANLHHQTTCAQLLLQHGADPSIPNFEGYRPVQLIDQQDAELLKLFEQP